MDLYEELAPLRRRLAKACRILGKLDVTKSTFGHISARVPGQDLVLIRARGPGESGVRYTEEDDVILVDFAGRMVAGKEGLSVPKEVFIHTALFKARPELGSVLHAHPLTVVLFSIVDKPLLPLIGAYDPSCLSLVTEGIPEYPSSVLIADDKLGKSLADVIKGARTCIMRSHGITTCGPTIEAATMNAIWLNDLAEINYRARLLGEPRPISAEDLKSFEKISGGDLSSYWRYYSRVTGEPEDV